LREEGDAVRSVRSVADGIRSGNIRLVEIRSVTDSNVRVVLDRESTRQIVAMVKAGKSEQQIRDFIRVRANTAPNPFAPKVEIREHRGFFGFLRHPFHKAETANLRHRICLSGPCAVCPTGQAHVIGGGCGGGAFAHNNHRFCQPLGACSTQNNFPDDCSRQRQALQEQTLRKQQAESAQQVACTSGASQACTDRTNAAQNEGTRYRTLQQQYQMCQRRMVSSNPFGVRATGNSSRGPLSTPAGTAVDHP
jgi:hypothetical protein